MTRLDDTIYGFLAAMSTSMCLIIFRENAFLSIIGLLLIIFLTWTSVFIEKLSEHMLDMNVWYVAWGMLLGTFVATTIVFFGGNIVKLWVILVILSFLVADCITYDCDNE